MGSQVQCKSYFSMRDLNEDSNSNNNWPLFYGDTNLMGVKLCNGYAPRSTADAYAEYDKGILKRKILEHEAIFRNQVYELHRLYRIQNDMIEDIRRKELLKRQSSIDPSSSSSIGGSQIPDGDSRKWRFSVNSGHPMCSPMSCTNGGDVLASDHIPSKVRKRLFDLQLPPADDEYLDKEEGCNMSNTIISPANNGCNGGGRIDCRHWRDVSTSESCRTSSMRLADLNEPVLVEDGIVSSSVDYILGASSANREERVVDLHISVNPVSQFLGSHNQNPPNVNRENSGPTLDHASVAKRGRDWLCDSYQPGPMNNNIISTSSHSIIGEMWQSNGRSRFVLGGSVDHLPFTNGFYRGSSSSSGSKETLAHHPSSRFSHLGSKIEESIDHKPLKVMDLNVEFSSNEEIDDKHNPNSMLPWLISAKPSHRTESVDNVKESPNEGKRRRLIDINLVCEEEEEEIVTCSRIHIDLNTDLDELEPTESCFDPVIDINEDHLLSEDRNHEKESSKSVPVEDEASLMAAEAIMSFSSSLLWFADAISTIDKENKIDRSNDLKHGKHSMDEFEIMTLQIKETKEEDYMPTPFFHQVQETEESGGGPTKSIANNRGRRRGGRQRRDFQRDILPGLASLSRHEITLDIQTFSGLMKKATGQTWRKCGSGSGRRRRRRRAVVEKASSFNGVSCTTTTTTLVHKLSTTIEASLEGWGGKIARRSPRRQRCPQVNNTNIVPLT